MLSGASSYSGSALRYGLIDVRPVEIVETIKKFGLKFRRVSRTFESLKPSRSYEDMATFDNELVFNSIDIPNWFEAEKLVKVFSQHSIDNYNRDVEFKDAIEKCRKASRIERPLLSLVQFVKNRFESYRDLFLEEEAKRFLNSNFPLSFYNKFVVFDNTYYDFLRVLEDIVRHSEFYAAYARSFDMYGKNISEMKRRLRPFLDQMDICLHSNSCLNRYMSIWNAKNYEELFAPVFLNIENVDYSQIEKLGNDLKRNVTEARRLLLDYDPKILMKESSFEDTTTKMFTRVVMLPAESLNLER